MATEYSSGLSTDRTHYGFWVDHSEHLIPGSTITVSSKSANIIIAFLSLTVVFAGSHAWDLTAFLLFHLNSTKAPQDGLDHQKQSILRNRSSPGYFLLVAGKMYWRWRTIAPRPLRRLIWVILLAFSNYAGFIVAGVLSGQIISATNIEVLVASLSCGHIISPYTSYFEVDPTHEFTSSTLQESLKYSRTCNQEKQSRTACQVYTKEFIAFEATHVECPFVGLCALSVSPALKLDTGLMDTSDTFGLNAAVEDRLLMRKVTTCAPLNVSEYLTVRDIDQFHAELIRGTSPLPGEMMTQLWLGPNPPLNETMWGSLAHANSTLTYSAHTSFYYGSNPSFQDSQYQTISSFEPIAPLMKDDADTIITGMSSNLVMYAQPINDPFFHAHRKTNVTFPDYGVSTEAYFADTIGCLGCIEQYQFCLPHSSRCTNLTGLFAALNQATTLNINGMQNATLYMLAAALVAYFGPNDFSLPGLLIELGTIQAASMSPTSKFQVQLPDNQWEVEVKGWMAWILALLQGRVAEISVGMGLVPDEQLESLGRIAPTSQDQVLCRSLRMKGPKGVSNISVLGLGIIISISGFIAVVNLLLPTVLKWRYRRGKAGEKSSHTALNLSRWYHYGELQVQRRAFEGFGVGGWRNDHNDVPVRSGKVAIKFPDLETLASAK